MNKTLSISLVAALGLIGGGAYMLMGTNKNFSEYVPDTVSSMLGDYLPSSLKAEPLVETPEVAFEEEPEQFEQQTQEDIQAKNQEQEVITIESQNDPVEEEQVDQQQEVEQSNDDVVSIAMDEIQKSINDEPTPIVTETTSENPKASNITKKIDDANIEISKLDIENRALEERFQNILRKNRELANKLKEIDEQLAN